MYRIKLNREKSTESQFYDIKNQIKETTNELLESNDQIERMTKIYND